MKKTTETTGRSFLGCEKWTRMLVVVGGILVVILVVLAVLAIKVRDDLGKAEKERRDATNTLSETAKERKDAANALAEATKKIKDATETLAEVERKEKSLAAKEAKLNDLVRVYGLQEEAPLTIEDVDAVLLLINHINWVVTKIKIANDPIVLEQEYESINQNALYLDAIKDKEVVNLVCNIMDLIVDMRIDAKEREMLQEELDQGMSDAIYDAVPNPMSLFSLNPVSSICNLATAAVSSYANYRKAKIRLAKQFKKATWDLDKNKMVFLNEMNKNLLRLTINARRAFATREVRVAITVLKTVIFAPTHIFCMAITVL